MAKGLDYIVNLLEGDINGVRKAKSEVSDLDGKIEKSESRFKSFTKVAAVAGGILAGVFATEKIVEFGKESYSAFKASESAAAQVSVAIKTTSGAAGKGLDELREKAEELESKTLFGDEQTLAADSLLLTFTKVKGAIFDEAVPAIQDIAQRMAGDGPADLKGAALQVGKALNDPLQGMNALRRVGVSFSDQQKKQIEHFQSHNQLAKAQAIILKELNTEFGGSAEAARKALGPMADFDWQIGETKKAVGKLISEGLDAIIPKMTTYVSKIKDGVEWLDKHKDALFGNNNIFAQAVDWLEDSRVGFEALGIGVAVSTIAFVAANPVVLGYTAGLVLNGIATGALAVVTGVMTAAQWALNFAMTANPIGIVVVAIGALAAGLYYAYQKSETFRAALAGIGSVAGVLLDVFLGMGKAVAGAMMGNLSLIKEGVAQGAKAINEINDKGITGIFKEGYNESLAESKKAAAEQAKKDKAAAPVATPTANQAYTKPPGSKGTPATVGGGKAGKTRSNEAVAGGNSVKHITITVQSLVKDFHQTVNNVRGQDMNDLRRIVTELLSEGVRDVEIMGD